VLKLEIVVNKLTESVVIGQFLQTYQKQYLKFGQVVAVVLVALAVTTVCTPQVAVVETTV
tara:strand:- start:191 stop:370 length:180 start_codon:yes stop_codon:yes gene_type:complete